MRADTTASGTCQITLSSAGENAGSAYVYHISPNVVRGMAGRVVEHCVGGGLGGYITTNIATTVEYITNPATQLDGFYPDRPSFLTVTVSGPVNRDLLDYPGNTHPLTGSVLAQHVMDRWLNEPPGSASLDYLARAAYLFLTSALRMVRGGGHAWYDTGALPPGR